MALSASGPLLARPSAARRQSPSSAHAAASDTQKSAERPAKKNPEAAPAPDETSQELMRAKILQLLEEVAESTGKWENAEVAAKIQALAADLIWGIEPWTARKYLAEAWERTSEIKPSGRERSRYRNESQKNTARQSVLLIARRRAPELAAEWLKQMADEKERSSSEEGRGVFDDRSARSAVLLQMAASSVAQDPEAARDLAIESLQDGISFGLQSVLLALQARDPDAAQAVLRAAVARIRVTGGADPSELLILYSYLYTPGVVAAPNSTPSRGSASIAAGRNRPTGFVPASVAFPALALEFLRAAADALIRAPMPSVTSDPQATARAQASAIGILLSRVNEKLPELGVQLRARLDIITSDARFAPNPNLDTETIKPGETRQEYAERQVESLEDRAGKEPKGMGRDILYAKAALATEPSDYEKGSGLARKIDDRDLRDGLENWLTYRATLDLIRLDSFENAFGLIGRNNDPAQKATSLVTGAQKLARAGRVQAAQQWLVEAVRLLSKIDSDEERTRIGFGIVAAYGQFDKAAALDTLTGIAGLIGGSSAGYDDAHGPEARRFSGIFVPAVTYETSGFGLQAAMDAFDKEQFESVLSALNGIKSPEIRAVSIVTLCRRYLKPTPAARPVKSVAAG